MAFKDIFAFGIKKNKIKLQFLDPLVPPQVKTQSAPLNRTPSLIEKRFDRLARPVLSLGEHLERLDDLLDEEAGDGLVRVGRGLHVLGDKVPRVGHRASVRLFCGLEHFG